MNIIDAVRSGCLIRRLSNKKLSELNSDGWVHPDYLINNVGITKADLNAEDWEVQEKEIKLTLSEFHKAYVQALKQCRHSGKLDVKNIREALIENIFRDSK